MASDVHPQTLDVVRTRAETFGFEVIVDDAQKDKAAPLLGEHTAAVLQELGYSDDEIAAMKQNHAI